MKKLLAAELAALLLLGGCFLPEKFTAKVTFEKDRSYTYEYVGTVAFLPALLDTAGGRGISAKTEKALPAEGAAYRSKNSDIKKLSYTGNGRFDAQIQGSKPTGSTTTILDIFVITNDQEGNQIVGVKAAAKDFAQFRDVSLKVDGRLTVKLPSNAKILRHNGNLSKGLWGWGSPSVQWTIQNSEQKPILVFATE